MKAQRRTAAALALATLPDSVAADQKRYDPSRDGDRVRRARIQAVARVRDFGRADLADDVALVVSELMTNALLHGGGCTGFDVRAAEDGVRVEVRDRSRLPPMVGRPSEGSLTGRGVQLVASLAARWGAEPDGEGGKVVWAELNGVNRPMGTALTEEALLTMWDDKAAATSGTRYRVEVGAVPTDLLLAAKSHVDNLVREFTLASAGAAAGLTADIPPRLAELLASVVDAFTEARMAIKHQALAAANAGEATTSLTLELPGHAAEAAEEYVRALDEVDSYCRARRLLTLETPPQHRVFRHWYVREVVAQVRAARVGLAPPPPQTFERRLLAELDRLAGAQRTSERAAKLYSVAVALASAATPEAVAAAVLDEGMTALGAVAGGVMLATEHDKLALSGAIGYDEEVLERLRNESRDAELPAALALRTGEQVWLESREERDRRFPELVGLEADTTALCAVPLEIQGRRLGALRFSFHEARLFDDDERRFVLALAALAAQALERAQLQQAKVDVSRRLQRSLLPRSLPELPGFDVEAIYHPFGDGMDIGGDFYDLWAVGPGRWAIALGDATGTGPEAATLTALVRHTLRAITMNVWDPATVIRHLNRALVEAATDEFGERFCTVVFAVVGEAHDGDVVVRIASGGHPFPLVRRADGTIETVTVGGTLLGVFPDVEVATARVSLNPSDTMIIFTDGVIEARGRSGMFGTDALRRVLAAAGSDAAAVANHVERAVLAHTGGRLNDDLAAVVLRVVPSG